MFSKNVTTNKLDGFKNVYYFGNNLACSISKTMNKNVRPKGNIVQSFLKSRH